MKQPALLKRIVAAKRQEISRMRKAAPLQAQMERLVGAPPTRAFREAVRRTRPYQIHMIAELKKASPVKGVLRPKLDVPGLAREFAAAGASALSVLTDARFFQGAIENLRLAKDACALPILRKDFILDPLQLYESRLAGADAVLLIVRLLPQQKLKDLLQTARNLSLAVVAEVHTAAEVKRALDCGADIIGVNTRDLATFKVDFATAAEVRPRIPAGRIAICESGLDSHDQVERLRELRYDAMLVGEVLMRARRPHVLVQELLHG